MIDTLDNYLSLLARSGLVEREELDRATEAFEDRYRSRPHKRTVRKLSKFLVKRRLLTRWQNANLLLGKHKGFFLGHYKLLNLIHTGGTGNVFLAEHRIMKRKVALKVLLPSLSKDREQLERFIEASQVSGFLDHPNFVRLFGMDGRDSVHYMIMEYIPGRTLERLVYKRGPLSWFKATGCMRQVAHAMACAHDQNVFHKALSPRNLILDPEGMVKMINVGVGGDRSSDTLPFLAPEQIEGEPPSPATDLYSLGATLYFLLTVTPPPLDRELKPLGEIRDDLPLELVELTHGLLSRDPADRPASMSAVAETFSKLRAEYGEEFEENTESLASARTAIRGEPPTSS